MFDILMENGKILEGKRARKIANQIVDKFAEEGLSYEEAAIVLDQTKSAIGEYSKIVPSQSCSARNS